MLFIAKFILYYFNMFVALLIFSVGLTKNLSRFILTTKESKLGTIVNGTIICLWQFLNSTKRLFFRHFNYLLTINF